MQGRTFLRIMIDNLFINNAMCRALSSLVNFCNEQQYFSGKELKFLKKMPFNNIKKDSSYKNKFIFSSAQKSGVDYK